MTYAADEKRLVLVIDDDPVMRELLQLHLVNAGYRVAVAEDGIAGGHAVLKNLPDVVVVDVDMPYMTGYELVEALKKDGATRNIPVVFLTSRDDVRERAGQLGAQAYLTKPVKANRLLELVALFTVAA